MLMQIRRGSPRKARKEARGRRNGRLLLNEQLTSTHSIEPLTSCRPTGVPAFFIAGGLPSQDNLLREVYLAFL